MLMKKSTILLGLLILSLICSQFYKRSHSHRINNSMSAPQTNTAGPSTDTASGNPQFKCDGRKYCSQMTSCEEATFFLKNCPGVQMDGDNDGVPCEKQWCK
jgi:hypothetical protein